jgi:ABC-type transporter Mla subunit MlaD
MVLNKRVVKGAESHVDFGYVASMSDKADLHQAVRHQTMAGILGQLSTLLSYANELYADLHRELSNDAQRISALAARTQAAYDYLPHLETYIHNTYAPQDNVLNPPPSNQSTTTHINNQF